MMQLCFDNDENAKLITNGEHFTIEAHLDKVANTKYWQDDSSYGKCHRSDISIRELMSILPAISEHVKNKIVIEEFIEEIPLTTRHKVDHDSLTYVTYRIYVNDIVVYDKDSLRDGSVMALREQVVAWVARFMYDYETISGVQ